MSETETEAITEPVVKKNKGGRPRKAVAAASTGQIAMTEDQFTRLLAAVAAASGGSAGGNTDPAMLKDLLAGAAIVAANHSEKVRNPSNDHHPEKSVFDYPEGGVARPKKVPPFQFLYNGYPCSKFPETEHWRECELMCEVKPGEYSVIRKDGTKMSATVRGETDASNALTKVDVQFSVSREERVLVPPKMVVLYQIVHAGEKSPRQLFIEAMTEWMNLTLGDPVAA
jgi:hypothetical protein